jgi:hypothetical protein
MKTAALQLQRKSAIRKQLADLERFLLELEQFKNKGFRDVLGVTVSTWETNIQNQIDLLKFQLGII